MSNNKKVYEYGFEKLEVWQISIQLVTEIYTVTGSFPDAEKFGLVSQLRRAAVSISSNIAEGNGREGKDKARFFQIAFSSLMEVLNQLIIASKLKYIEGERLYEIRTTIDEIANKLNALHRYAKSKS
ncbi:four helix bundle protein [Luteibaculum oceani]|uniref:Four helix bundle protein n=1 Tax=Luteibaculum oceani TaxID=1294296 RepID=A0A5C6VEB0_9FLAO|nr:four helix bundle protein [Luteibaculum oceani]TXC81418.1 four helix bundle protein [Luteibaculum oceani]